MTDKGNPKPTQADIYAKRGQCRHMVIISTNHRDRLKSLAKSFKVPQGVLVEVMIDQLNLEQISGAVALRREARSSERPSKAALIKQIKRLGPSELIAFQALLAQKPLDVER